VAVMIVAFGILILLMVWVVPQFQQVFAGMNMKMPGFTLLVLAISNMIKDHFLSTMGGVIVVVIIFLLIINKTKVGRLMWDKFTLKMPALGPVISKVAISRFTRTLGTLVSSGVPILQALTIVKETAGNVVISNAIVKVHESVKEGETITAPLEASGVFPPMVVSMVDVGEQTGAMPEMLLKIADNYDEEVDNAVSAMTSLLEPIMIVFLAVIVGSIVIAMFLPLINMISNLSGDDDGGGAAKD
jgi:type IV pilus assembly protein PilC